METKINYNRAQIVIQSFKIPNYVKISPKGLLGVILLLSLNNSDFTLDIIDTSNSFTHCRITDNEEDVSWLGTLFMVIHTITFKNNFGVKFLILLRVKSNHDYL